FAETSGSYSGNANRLSDVLSAAISSMPANNVEVTNFIGSDGFSPTSKPTCAAYLPIPWATLTTNAYIDPATSDLVWDSSLSYAGCIWVSGTNEIDVAEQP